VLASLFLVVILVDNYQKSGKIFLTRISAIPESNVKSKSERFVNAVKGSLTIFLDTSVYFSAVMLLAALYMRIKAAVDPKGVSKLESTMSLMTSLFSTYPMLLASALSAHGSKAKFVRSAKIWLILLLTFINVMLGYKRYKVQNFTWEKYCDDVGGPFYKNIINAITSVTAAAWGTSILLQRSRTIPFSTVGKRRRVWMKTLCAFILFLAMWVMLSLLTALRQRFIAAAGRSNNENAWTFGQIIALATWTPVIVDFSHLYICKFFSAYMLLGFI